MQPAASKNTILNQICNQIPRNLVPKLARKHGVDKKARYFTPWSHVVAMLHAQLANSLSLNDVADTMRNHAGGHKALNSKLLQIKPCKEYRLFGMRT